MTERGFAVGMLGRDDGLPSTQVHAMVEGPNGALWFAGPAGLSRYDGSSIRVFGPRQGLTTQGLRSLAADGEGSIWIGHDRGIDRRRPDGVIESRSGPKWAFGFVDAIAVDRDGAWLGTPAGLVRWTTSDDARRVDAVPAALVTGVAVVDGTVWAAGPAAGVWRGDGNGWVEHTDDVVESIAPVHTLSASPDGGILLGGSRGVAAVDGSLPTRLLWSGEDADSAVMALLPVDGELWIARGGQLDALKPVADASWRPSGRLMSNVQVNQLIMDSHANVWVATDSDGVAKISVLRRAVAHGRMPCDTQVYSIRRSLEGGVLIGGEQCSWFMDDPISAPVQFAGLNRIKVWDLVQTGDGSMWAATQLGLYGAQPGGRFEPTDLRSPLGTAPGRALLERGSTLWVATVEGLFEVNSKGVSEVGDASGQSLGYVYTLTEDAAGRLWVGTIGRGAFHEDDSGRLVALEGQLLNRDSNVYAIAHDGAGRSALVQDDAVLYLDANGWRRLPAATNDNVAGWSLQFADAENLWLGSSSGLVQYRMPEGSLTRRLTRNMGLSGSEFTTSRSLSRYGDGRLLLGLDAGLTVVDPPALDRLTRRPSPQLSSVIWTQASLDESEAIPVVAYGSWALDLTLSSSWFIDERGLIYQYRLLGFDQHWSPARDRTLATARYTGLPSGDYRFVARVFTPLFGWGEEFELYRFVVDRPWWAQPATLALWVALIIGLIAALIRWRTASLSLRARILKEEVRERTRDLQLANEQLERMVSQDSLTGVMNRRALWSEAERFQAIADRERLVLGLIVFDLDHFKSINDRYGHPIGDDVLVHVAGVVSEMLRKGEVLARWGGEEFVVLLAPSSETPDLLSASERIRLAVENGPMDLEDGRRIDMTTSVGASLWVVGQASFEDVLKQADEALYQAKKTRNASVVWSESDSSQS